MFFFLIDIHTPPRTCIGSHSCSTCLASDHVLPLAFCFGSALIMPLSLSTLSWCIIYLLLLPLPIIIVIAIWSSCCYCRLINNIYIYSYCYCYSFHCLMLPINSTSYSRLLLSYWVWWSLKISTFTEFQDIPKSLILSLKISQNFHFYWVWESLYPNFI